MEPSDLRTDQVARLLRTRWCGRSLTIVADTRSTNDDARSASLAGAAHGHVIVADHQSAGRGSRGRSWVSPAGTDLYLSVLVHATVPMAELAPLTLAIGVAVAEAVEGELGAGPSVQVKWPNDVWVDRHKVAGILVESSSLGERSLPLVIGVGMNVNRLDFPDDLDTPATSLAIRSGSSFARAEVLARLLDRVEHWVDRFLAEGVAAVAPALVPRLALLGEEARCDGLVGRVRGLSEQGALLLDTADGVREVVSGTLRPIA